MMDVNGHDVHRPAERSFAAHAFLAAVQLCHDRGPLRGQPPRRTATADANSAASGEAQTERMPQGPQSSRLMPLNSVRVSTRKDFRRPVRQMLTTQGDDHRLVRWATV